jgi:sugar phosphate isomerase/epimerase
LRALAKKDEKLKKHEITKDNLHILRSGEIIMDVKLGICNFCVPGTGVFAPQLVAEAGLDGMSIEFGTYEKGFPLSNRRVQDAYKEARARYGIQYCNIGCSGFDFIPFYAHQGHAFYDVVRKFIKDAIAAAAYLDIPLVFMPSFHASAIDTEDQFKNAVKMFRYACDLASDKGIMIGNENMLDASMQIRLCEEVGHDNFGIFYDSDNYFFNKGYDQVDILEAIYEHLTPQLHVKDGKRGVLAGALLGHGDARFNDVIAYLKKRDYKGWIIIENLYEQQPLRGLNEDVYATFRRDVEILKAAVK